MTKTQKQQKHNNINMLTLNCFIFTMFMEGLKEPPSNETINKDYEMVRRYLKLAVALSVLGCVNAQAFSGFTIVSKKKMFESREYVCVDGQGTYVPQLRQNVHTATCDYHLDQIFNIYVNGNKAGPDPVWQYEWGGAYPAGYYVYPGSGWFELRPTSASLPDNLCLDVEGRDGGKSKSVTFFSCTGEDDQKWRFDNGKIINKKQGLCLDIAGYSGEAEKDITVFTCEGYLDQEWLLMATF